MRPDPLSRLLESVCLQIKLPDEILIIDGSTNDATQKMLQQQFQSQNAGVQEFENKNTNITQHIPHASYLIPQGSCALNYYKVPPEHRGLTKQRNYGIERLSATTDIVAFLDDDTVLSSNYFENLIQAFKDLPDAAGIGGVATNENRWEAKLHDNYNSINYYETDGYVVRESARNRLRNKLGLSSNELPGVMPVFGHGRTFSYPLTGKNYSVDLLVGMSMAFRKTVTDKLSFSSYFEGYGLYEDADYSLRALRYGQLYLATSVQLEHHHAAAGRPNMYNYGKMVVRNGWYVWRVKHPEPSFKNKIKWYQITIVLTAIRFMNIFTTSERKEAFRESLGRTVGITSLIFSKPK